MSKFIDVVPGHFAFNDIEELYYVQYEQGKYFFTGIPYNTFVSGKEPLQEDVIVTVNGQSEFVFNKVIYVALDCPMKVYVDGVDMGYDMVKPNYPAAGQTYIKLRRGVQAGGTVRFFSAGVPQIDTAAGLNRPVGADPSSVVPPSVPLPYPNHDGPWVYKYKPDVTTEIVRANGVQLRRVEGTDMVRITENSYTIYEEKLFVHFELNRVKCACTFRAETDWGMSTVMNVLITPVSSNIVYTNRFFPDGLITRGEIVSIINRLRKDFIARYTDSVAPSESKQASVRFYDVPQSAWFFQDVIDLEDAKLGNGLDVIFGQSEHTFNGNKSVRRDEAVAMFNRARQWFIDILK